MEPFNINISDSVLQDLKRRLAATRWPDEISNDKWELGTNKKYLQEICDYWANEFDWRKQERTLNSFDQYKTEIDGHGIHFIYQKSNATDAVPLLLTHGFPDSFIRFTKLIPLLTNYGFDVVVPSIPGYGFSDRPTAKGMNPKKVADLFNKLMTKELGFKKYYAHGGDWGTSITEQIALYHQDSLLGIHFTDVPFGHGLMPLENPSKDEQAFREKTQRWVQTEGAYATIQATKPQSLAYGLNDSPAALAAWILDKFYAWSDNQGKLENSFTKDELLTNITIYWVTETFNSSFRMYYEAIQSIMNAQYNPLVKLNPFDKTNKKEQVPAAFAFFIKDISSPPREYAERFFNVQRWSHMKKGGHFAALEDPQLLSEDIRAFAEDLSLFAKQ